MTVIFMVNHFTPYSSKCPMCSTLRFLNVDKKVLDFLENNEADLVLSDLQMPEMNGIELTTKIHERFPEVRLLILFPWLVSSPDIVRQ